MTYTKLCDVARKLGYTRDNKAPYDRLRYMVLTGQAKPTGRKNVKAFTDADIEQIKKLMGGEKWDSK